MKQSRRAGAWQAIGLLLTIQIPIVPIMALAPNLPQLIRHFSALPQRDFLVPLVITLPSLGIVLLAPIAGALADRWGRRGLLLTALVLFAAAGSAPLYLDGLYAILGAQAVVGVAEAIILTNANALLGDYFSESERVPWLGFQSIMSPLFAAIITLLAGVLGNLSWRAPFGVNLVAALMWLWLWLSSWEPERSSPPGPGRVDGPSDGSVPWARVLPVLAVTVVTSLVFYVPTIHFGLIYERLGAGSPALISVLTTVGTVGSVPAGYYFRMKQRRPASNLTLLYALFGVGLLGISLSKSYLTGLMFGIVINGAIGLTLPSLVAWILQCLPDASRGRGVGVWMSAFFVGQLLCPLLFATLLHRVSGLGNALLAVAVGCLALALMSVVNALNPLGSLRSA